MQEKGARWCVGAVYECASGSVEVCDEVCGRHVMVSRSNAGQPVTSARELPGSSSVGSKYALRTGRGRVHTAEAYGTCCKVVDIKGVEAGEKEKLRNNSEKSAPQLDRAAIAGEDSGLAVASWLKCAGGCMSHAILFALS